MFKHVYFHTKLRTHKLIFSQRTMAMAVMTRAGSERRGIEGLPGSDILGLAKSGPGPVFGGIVQG